MAYKRKTKKTGDTTQRTTTQNQGGRTRITNTTKSSLGGKNKRTYSSSFNKNGGLRQTTTDNINGWVKRKTRTIGGKSLKPRTSRRKSGGDMSFGGVLVFGAIIILAILAFSAPWLAIVAGIILGIWLFWILLPWIFWGAIFYVVYLLFFR